MAEPTDERCRIDVWLWRARLFKTRTQATKFADEGRVRLTRDGVEGRIDKAARTVRVGDELVFARLGRVSALKIRDLGERRGPASEARALYSVLSPVSAPEADAAPEPRGRR